MRGTEPPRGQPDVPLAVRLPGGDVLRFSAPFLIGREQGCDIQIDDVHVSRRHAEVTQLRGRWVVRDLQSSNGVFVEGERVDTAPIGEGVTITLGADGPVLRVYPESAVAFEPAAPPGIPEESTLLDAYAQRYFGSEEDESVGGRTLMIRKAFQKVQGQQKRRHRWTVAAVALLALSVAGYALYQYRVIRKQTEQAQAIFYRMKELDVQVAQLEQIMAQSGTPEGRQQVARFVAQRRAMERDYEAYVAELYDRNLNEKDRLILRVTRMFGECEVAAPQNYVVEVKRYIEKWRSTNRFVNAIKRARDHGYTRRIANAFIAHDLPPQFFYLAMQESDFDPSRSGPPTRWGIAKGMWQFIPETGQRYGLRIGPRASVGQFDALDERFNWERATVAAAKYIKDIYTTDAQASGLLVMASYNWGEHRVIDRVRTMPDNPRDRNFWKLLERHNVPDQTRDYVFHIVSAAVIGENPKLFGFDLENPLKSPEGR